MTSWLASRFGRRRYFVGSILLFTVASFLCGARDLAPRAGALPHDPGHRRRRAALDRRSRIMVETFPPQRQGTGQAIFGVGATLGPSLGPTLGGWITDQWSWPWIFYVNVPLGIVAAILCWSYLPDRRSTCAAPRASTGSGSRCSSSAIGALQTLLERGNQLRLVREPDHHRATGRHRGGLLRLVRLARAAHADTRSSTCACSATARCRSAACYGAVDRRRALRQRSSCSRSSRRRCSTGRRGRSGLAMLPSPLTTALMMPIAGRARVGASARRRSSAPACCVFVPTLSA